jgi:uncharacterized membrane protein YqiK
MAVLGTLLLILMAIVGVLVGVTLIVKNLLYLAGPNEALVFSAGRRSSKESASAIA